MVSKVLSLRHSSNPPFRSYCKSHKSSATGKGMYGSLLQKLTERGGECGTPTQNIWIASLSGLCQVAVGIIRPSVWRPGSAVMWPWLIVTSVFWVKEQTICHNERQHKFIVGCEYRHHRMQLQLQAKTNKQRKGKKTQQQHSRTEINREYFLLPCSSEVAFSALSGSEAMLGRCITHNPDSGNAECDKQL